VAAGLGRAAECLCATGGAAALRRWAVGHGGRRAGLVLVLLALLLAALWSGTDP
jgi:hypothetical protein